MRAGLHQAMSGGAGLLPAPVSGPWRRASGPQPINPRKVLLAQGPLLETILGRSWRALPYPRGAVPFHTPITHTKSPHLLCLKEPPICSLFLGQSFKTAPAEGRVEATLSPSFPSHHLSLSIPGAPGVELGIREAQSQGRID